VSTRPPVLESRDEAAFVSELARRAPGFTPELELLNGGPASALAKIFARYMAVLARGLNRVPERQLLGFLDTLGTRLLPAESGRAPVVFTLMDESPVDPLLPADSQVAAPEVPLAPSPLNPPAEPGADEAVVFATTGAVTLTRAKLAALYALLPGEDTVGDYTAIAASPFSLFGDMQPVEHAVYLGHDQFFALSGEAEIRLFVTLSGGRAWRQPLEIAWEYLSEDGWLPLALDPDDDDTHGFSDEGEIRLFKSQGPDSQSAELGGRTSFWVRGRLLTSLPPDALGGSGFAPQLDGVRTQVAFTKSEISPDAGVADPAVVDITRNFYPFSTAPARYSTFYLASDEVFQRARAHVTIAFELSEVGVVPSDETLVLAFEFWDGKSWIGLEDYDFVDDTLGFTQNGSVTFRCPPNWKKTTVATREHLWLRVRIVQGSYGHPTRIKQGSNPIEVEATTLAPPVVDSALLSFTYQTEPSDIDACVTFNEFSFTDATDDCRWPRRVFQPFQALRAREPAVYFGFDEPLPSGLVSLYVAAEPADVDSMPDPLAFVWEYETAQGWVELNVLDETDGFRKNGMIQLIGQSDAVPSDGLGGSLYRLRARLKEGAASSELQLRGVWLNAAWVTNRTRVQLEPLGLADGNPNQSFFVQPRRVPVLESEVVEVREWAGTGSGYELLLDAVPEGDARLELDRNGKVVALWVRWYERPHLFDSGPDDRVYVIERATGRISVGDSVNGAIPPAGSRVVISYFTGDGVRGNVAAGSITELRAGVPYLSKFENPDPSTGGAATEALERVYRRGPERLRHRGRGVSVRDYEWLAREASAAVARARCLPVTGVEGAVQPGCVTLVVVPEVVSPRPILSEELRRRISDHLAACVPATVVGNVFVIGPTYVDVGVSADIVPLVAEDAAVVEARVQERLDAFLHPLTGGRDGTGWDFGDSVSLSQIATLIETTTGVDYAPRVTLRVGDALADEWVSVAPDQLVAAGVHELKLMLGGSH
jgi:predicted phage baseplate assembly protein